MPQETPPSPNLAAVLAANVKRVREELNLTQAEFAEVVGLTQPSISRLERAVEGSGWHTLRQLGEAIAAAGGDPLELLQPRGGPQADPQMVEICALLEEADAEAKRLVLDLL